VRVPSELRPYVKAAVAQGWRYELSGHNGRLYPPCRPGKRVPIVLVPHRVKDRTALRNKIAELRRAGLRLPK
jgi:hypothetical protein